MSAQLIIHEWAEDEPRWETGGEEGVEVVHIPWRMFKEDYELEDIEKLRATILEIQDPIKREKYLSTYEIELADWHRFNPPLTKEIP